MSNKESGTHVHAAPVVKHEELHATEEVQVNAAAQQVTAAPVQREQEPTQGIYQLLRDEDFLSDDVVLSHADSMFHQENVLTRQRDAATRSKAGGKLARWRAKKQQGAYDAMRGAAIQNRMRAADSSHAIDSDTLVARTVLQTEINERDNLLRVSPRQDLTGQERRRHEKHFGKATELTPELMAAAHADVQNLVRNLRLDLCLDGNDTLPPDLQLYADAYYFTYKYGNNSVNARKAAADKAFAEGRISEVERKACLQEITKLEQFVLLQKSVGSNVSPMLNTKAKGLRARKLALRQIQDEGDSIYHRQMIAILAQEIIKLSEDLKIDTDALRTCNNTQDTPRGQAFLETQADLARIRREMKALGESEEDKKRKEALEQEGQQILLDYTYDGPLIKGS